MERVYLHLLAGARAYSPALLADTVIGGSGLCSCGVSCREGGQALTGSVPVLRGEAQAGGWLVKKSRGGNHIHQPFSASCLTSLTIHPPARAPEHTSALLLQVAFGAVPAHTGDNGHLFGGWAKADILRGWDINHRIC